MTKLFLCSIILLALLVSVECRRRLYHYTNQAGIEGMKRTSEMRKSTGSHAHFGDGVYFTELLPTTSKEILAMNNYGKSPGVIETKIRQGYLDYYIAVDFPNDDNLKDASHGHRDIWVYKDKNLDLEKFQHQFGKTREK